MTGGQRIAAVLVPALLAAGAGALLVYDAARDDRIGDGVRVAGVDVGGMTEARARSVLAARLGPRYGPPVVVRYGGAAFRLAGAARLDGGATAAATLRRSRRGNPFGRALRELAGGAVDADVEPVVAISRPAVHAFVRRIAARIDRPARDADIDVVAYRIRRRPARDGLAVRRAELERRIARILATPRRSAAAIVAPVTVTRRPDRTMADLRRRYPSVITISRRRKILRLYRRLRLARTFRIAVGGVGHRTPPGRYAIQSKVVDPPWHVPQESWAGDLAGKTIPPGDPRNPLEARWLGFHDGAGIHGTRDITSLGDAASHGCIRMSVHDVEALYRRVKVGTPVYVA
jgi:lipoprotein-anchoring transpeptidase ErfK/SrfK